MLRRFQRLTSTKDIRRDDTVCAALHSVWVLPCLTGQKGNGRAGWAEVSILQDVGFIATHPVLIFRRIPFTKEDDMYLCQSLARLMPDKNAGGRQGLKIYETFMNMVGLLSMTVCFYFFTLCLWSGIGRNDAKRIRVGQTSYCRILERAI